MIIFYMFILVLVIIFMPISYNYYRVIVLLKWKIFIQQTSKLDENLKKQKITKKNFRFFSLVGKILTIYFTHFYTGICKHVKMAKNPDFQNSIFLSMGDGGSIKHCRQVHFNSKDLSDRQYPYCQPLEENTSI